MSQKHLPIPRPVVRRGTVESLHGCQKPLAGWHGGRQSDVLGVKRPVVAILKLIGNKL